MAKTVTSANIKMKRVRQAFVNLDTASYFKPDAPGPNEKKKFRTTFLLDPSNAEHAETIKAIKAEAARICKLVWPDNEKGESTVPKNSLDKCFGTDKDLDKVYDGFKDMFFIRAARNEDKGRPGIVGRRRTGPIDAKTGKPTFVELQPGNPEWPRGGDFVNATINLWILNNHGQKRIMANLEAVQFVEKGESFGGSRPNADAEFEALEDNTPVDATDDDDLFN